MLSAYVVLIAIENVAVGLGCRAEFVGTWEMGSARLYLSPLALAIRTVRSRGYLLERLVADAGQAHAR